MNFYDCAGYDLHTHPETWTPNRVLLYLNVWNDRPELERSLPTWRPYVDLIIAIDGAYEGLGHEQISTDGTRGLLEEHDALIINSGQMRQHDKRSLYWEIGKTGDLCIVLDADESLEGGEALRGELPYFDVGWIRYTAPIYARPQNIPRLFRWRPGYVYRHRHHWLYHLGHSLICTNQRGGPGLVHRSLPLAMHNTRGRYRPEKRQHVALMHRGVQMQQEKQAASGRVVGHEPLRIMQAAPFDPGAVCYRFHTAINTTSPHTSVLSTATAEWTKVPRQFDHVDDHDLVSRLSRVADVTHYHVNRAAPVVPARWTVMHHHGTEYRIRPFYWNDRDEGVGLRLVSNFELMQYGDDLNWLPNPMPVAEYRRLRQRYGPKGTDRPFTIAHSPTKRKNKGTDAFLEAVDIVKQRGVNVAVAMIHKVPIKHALEIKASADAVFDSFWLGIQCSGLEGAAMGIPVLAGDPDCKAAYEDMLGHVPYTYANDTLELAEQIERLATDPDYYHAESTRVATYCLDYHDQANVVARYLDLLDDAVHWRDNMEMGTP